MLIVDLEEQYFRCSFELLHIGISKGALRLTDLGVHLRTCGFPVPTEFLHTTHGTFLRLHTSDIAARRRDR